MVVETEVHSIPPRADIPRTALHGDVVHEARLEMEICNQVVVAPQANPVVARSLASLSVTHDESNVTPWIVQKTPSEKIPLSEFTIRMLRPQQSATLLMAIAL